MKCSIVVPIYNCPEKELFKCLDALMCLNNDYEIILIDDGSDDYIQNVVNKYDFKYYKQKNKGVSAARNYGINKASGKYILFCDADDFICYDILNNINFSYLDYDFIYSDYFKHKNNKKKKIILCADSIDDYRKNLLCYSNLFGTVWGKFYKREIIINNNLEFNEDLTHSEDSVFLMKYLMNCQSIHKIDSFYNYNVYYDSLAKSNPNAVDMYVESMKKMYGLAKDGDLNQYIGNYCNTNLLITMVNHLSSKDFVYFKETMTDLLNEDIIHKSLNNYSHKDCNKINNIVLFWIKNRMYLLSYFASLIKRRL